MKSTIMRGFILLVLSLLSTHALAATRRTQICIENKSASTYYISGVGLDNFDWEDLYDNGAMNRPDHNWVNKEVKPSEVRCELADINAAATGVGFWFAVSSSQSSQVIQTRLQITYIEETKGQAKHIHVDHWITDADLSDPVGAPGRLHSPKKCLDPKDPVAKTCTLFVINK